MNLGPLLQSALATAKSLSVAATVTVSDGTTPFTVTATREDPSPESPPSGGSKSSTAPRFTMAAADCSYMPDYGHTITDANSIKYRVLATTVIGPAGTDLLYVVEVAS